MTIILVFDLFVKQNIAATKICCSENLTVDEIRFMLYTNVGSQNHIPLHIQTVAWRYQRYSIYYDSKYNISGGTK